MTRFDRAFSLQNTTSRRISALRFPERKFSCQLGRRIGVRCQRAPPRLLDRATALTPVRETLATLPHASRCVPDPHRAKRRRPRVSPAFPLGSSARWSARYLFRDFRHHPRARDHAGRGCPGSRAGRSQRRRVVALYVTVTFADPRRPLRVPIASPPQLDRAFLHPATWARCCPCRRRASSRARDDRRASARTARAAVPLAARRAFAPPPASFATRARAGRVSTVTRAAIFQNAAAKQQAVARLEAQLAPAAAADAPTSGGRQLEDEPQDAAGG